MRSKMRLDPSLRHSDIESFILNLRFLLRPKDLLGP